MKKFGTKGCYYLAVIALSIITSLMNSCSKYDDIGDKFPVMNQKVIELTENVSDSLYEIYGQDYYLSGIVISDKNSKEDIAYASLSHQDETSILDSEGNKLGDIKYGKNDTQEIDIYEFCTIKRKIDKKKGKFYIITPAKNKKPGIFIYLNISLKKGAGISIPIH